MTGKYGRRLHSRRLCIWPSQSAYIWRRRSKAVWSPTVNTAEADNHTHPTECDVSRHLRVRFFIAEKVLHRTDRTIDCRKRNRGCLLSNNPARGCRVPAGLTTARPRNFAKQQPPWIPAFCTVGRNSRSVKHLFGDFPIQRGSPSHDGKMP